MIPLETTGKFWALGDDNRRADGLLNWKPGTDAELRLQSRVVDSLASPVTLTTNGYMVRHSAAADRVVADRVPRVLLGDTAAGVVTGIDSYMRGGFGLGQVWDLQTLVVGAHFAAGNSTRVEAVRFILDGPGWWEHLPDRGAATDDAGVILCERTTDDLMWFEVHPTFAMTLRSAQRAVRSVLTLMKLAVDVDLTPLRVQVREPGQTLWLDVKSRELDPSKASWPDPDNLLPADSVTLERIARWLAIEQTMDGLAAAVANPVEGAAIQVHALVACSLVEGVHKRIVGTDKVEYIKRARELQVTAQRIAPDITDPVTKWAELVREVRNQLAHHNSTNTGSFDEQFLGWMIAESSALWVLRLCLLSHAGFTDREIADALSDHLRYDYYRENLKMHVKERGGLSP